MSDCSALSIELTNRFTNQVSKYWYTGSMLARSVMEKKRMEDWTVIVNLLLCCFCYGLLRQREGVGGVRGMMREGWRGKNRG